MSILFDDASSEYAEAASAVSVAFPFAMGCWAYIDDLDVDQTLLSLANSASENNHLSLVVIGRKQEVTDITTVADVAGSLEGTYFTIDSPSTAYYVWISIDSGSVDPAPVGKTGIQVDITINDTANAVASAIQAAIDALGDFGASVSTNTVTVTNAAVGSVTDAADVDTGFTINVTTQGTDNAVARARIVDNTGTEEYAEATLGLSVNTWHNILGVFSSPAGTTIEAYVDGANQGQITGGSTALPTGLNRTAMGRLSKLTPSEYTSGRVAEASIWDLSSVLTTDDINDLGADMIAPHLVRVSELSFYTPAVIQVGTTIVDIITNNNLTAVNTPTDADHPAIQYFDPETFARFRAGPVEFTRLVTQNLVIGSIANFEITRPASSSVGFGQAVQHNVIVLNVETNIGFTQDHRVNTVLDISVVHSLGLTQNYGPTVEDSASNSVTFSSEAARAGDPSNDVLFDQVIVADKSTGVENDILFGQDASPQIELGKSVSNSVTFGQQVLAYIDVPCNRHEYDPQGANMPTINFAVATSINFTCGIDSIDLPNPEFGNSEDSAVDRVLNVSRGGTPQLVRDTQWTKNTEITIEINTLTRVKAQELLDFLLNCVGLLTTYTDHEGRQWQGIITNPEDAVTENRDFNCGEYTANIIFVGSPV